MAMLVSSKHPNHVEISHTIEKISILLRSIFLRELLSAPLHSPVSSNGSACWTCDGTDGLKTTAVVKSKPESGVRCNSDKHPLTHKHKHTPSWECISLFALERALVHQASLCCKLHLLHGNPPDIIPLGNKYNTKHQYSKDETLQPMTKWQHMATAWPISTERSVLLQYETDLVLRTQALEF